MFCVLVEKSVGISSCEVPWQNNFTDFDALVLAGHLKR